MPYPTNAALPASIQGHLPPHAQDIYREAFNHAFAAHTGDPRLEDHRDDPVVQELKGFIGALTQDEQIDLVALAWLGRGDGDIGDWEALRAEAAHAHNNRTASYLLGMPHLPDHLEEALSEFGGSCQEFEMGHL